MASSTSVSLSSTSMSSSRVPPDEKKDPHSTFFVPRNLQRSFSFDESRQWSLPAEETAFHLIHSDLSIDKQVEVFRRLFPQIDKAEKEVSSAPLEKSFKPKGPLKSADNKLDSRFLCEAFLSFLSDEELSKRVDLVEVREKDGLKNNPLDYIHKRLWGNCNQAVQKMALRYPVNDHHLKLAVLSGYTSETIRAMLDQAILYKRFPVQESLGYLISQDYPDELIRLFCKHADNVEYSAFKLAQSRADLSDATIEALLNKVSLDALIRRDEPEALILSALGPREEADNESLDSAVSRPDISLTTIEAILDKVPEVREEVWEAIFSRIFPSEHSANCFFDSAFENDADRMELRMITPEFWNAYSKQFQDKPWALFRKFLIELLSFR